MPTITPTISSTALHQVLTAAAPPRLLDVREPEEYVSELGHIAGAELVPLGTLATQIARFIGETRDVVVICRSGMRAQKAAELLAANGVKSCVLTGGMLAWNEAHLPIER